VLLKLLFSGLVLALDIGHGLVARARIGAHYLLTQQLNALKTSIYLALGLVIIASGASYAVVTLGPDASMLRPSLVTQEMMLKPLSISALPASSAIALSSELGADGFTKNGFEDLVSLPSSEPPVASDAPRANDFYATEWSRGNESTQSVLARLGVFDATALNFIVSTPSTRQLLLGKNPRLLSASTDQAHHLKELIVRWADEDPNYFNRLTLKKSASGFEVQTSKAQYQTQLQVAGARIRSSLFQATDQARIPDAVANQLAEIFSGDIDFHRALRQGDRFSLMYEALLADGEVLKTGKILNAEFINRGKSYQAVWFAEPNNAKGDYYAMDGMNLRKTFLAAPLAFSRVTSGFSMRMHPILQTWKAHLGVDYAAPTGAPVRTVGNGFVESTGYQNGFGNVVFIKHPQGPVTVYAHLSRIDVKKGQTVTQGAIIGAVGQTGWATGPHLHFEFRLNGQHQDPMTLAKQNTPIPLASEFKSLFQKQAQLAKTVLSGLSTLETVDID